MGTFLSSALALASLLQAFPDSTPADSAARLRARVAADSGDGRAWLELGRELLRLSAVYHRHADTVADTTWARAALDSADDALARAAALLVGTRTADSARVLRVRARGERAQLAWELGGAEAAPRGWGALGGDDLRLPPVLEELGENLLRGCPRGGVLLTATDLDTEAARYMWLARGLRPDLLVIPLDAWRGDTVLRARVARELRLERPPRRGAGAFPWLRRLAERRPLCATVAFERPPAIHAGGRWHGRPLLWVTGPRATADRVPPRDFVFAAARLGVDERDTWVAPVIALYRGAVRETPALCEPLGVYKLREEVGCK